MRWQTSEEMFSFSKVQSMLSKIAFFRIVQILPSLKDYNKAVTCIFNVRNVYSIFY